VTSSLLNQAGPFQRISELHVGYMALHYPLLFPYGEDGWHPNIQLNGVIADADLDEDHVEESELQGKEETLMRSLCTNLERMRIDMNKAFLEAQEIRNLLHGRKKLTRLEKKKFADFREKCRIYNQNLTEIYQAFRLQLHTNHARNWFEDEKDVARKVIADTWQIYSDLLQMETDDDSEEEDPRHDAPQTKYNPTVGGGAGLKRNYYSKPDPPTKATNNDTLSEIRDLLKAQTIELQKTKAELQLELDDLQAATKKALAKK